MANTTYILEKIKLESTFADIIAKSNADNITVRWNDADISLASALASIYTNESNCYNKTETDTAISTAIGNLINGAPETYDTLKEIADYINSNEEAVTLLNNAVANKVDKIEGKGLSAEDFTSSFKSALEGLVALNLTSERVSAWDNKAEKTTATQSADGLMSAADKTRLDSIRGVRFGSELPSDMLEGEIFVRVVQDDAQA